MAVDKYYINPPVLNGGRIVKKDKEFEEFEEDVLKGKLELEALIASNYTEAADFLVKNKGVIVGG